MVRLLTVDCLTALRQLCLGDTTEETSKETIGALKRLRRTLPITGQRMDWSANAHRALPRGAR